MADLNCFLTHANLPIDLAKNFRDGHQCLDSTVPRFRLTRAFRPCTPCYSCYFCYRTAFARWSPVARAATVATVATPSDTGVESQKVMSGQPAAQD